MFGLPVLVHGRGCVPGLSVRVFLVLDRPSPAGWSMGVVGERPADSGEQACPSGVPGPVLGQVQGEPPR